MPGRGHRPRRGSRLTSTTWTFLGLVLGLGLGILLSVFWPAAVHPVTAVVEPIGTLWMNAIRMTVIPLVVSTLVGGVVAATETGTMGRLGVTAATVFAALVAASGLYAAAAVPPLVARLPIDPATIAAFQLEARTEPDAIAERARSMPAFADWLISLVPSNAIGAAAEGAMLPLRVFTIAFALALAATAEEVRRPLLALVRAIADAMLVLVGWVLAIAPIGVFALALPLAARVGAATAGIVGAYVLVVCALVAVYGLMMYPLAVVLGGTTAAVRARVPPGAGRCPWLPVVDSRPSRDDGVRP